MKNQSKDLDKLNIATYRYLRTAHSRIIDGIFANDPLLAAIKTKANGYENDTDPFGDWVAEVRREQEELDGINGS